MDVTSKTTAHGIISPQQSNEAHIVAACSYTDSPFPGSKQYYNFNSRHINDWKNKFQGWDQDSKHQVQLRH